MNKLFFALGVALTALAVMWWRLCDLADENDVLTAALGGLAANMAIDDSAELSEEWGE